MVEEEIFPLEKILSISAQEYVGPDRAVRDNYNCINVECILKVTEEGTSLYNKGNLNPRMQLAKHVPKDAEIVVGYHLQPVYTERSLTMVTAFMYGTALIPKNLPES